MHQRISALLLTLTATAWLLVGCGNTPKQGIARGKELFQTCVPCHGVDGAGNRELGAPAIAGESQWYLTEQLDKFKGGIRGAHPDDAEGHRMRPMARSLTHEGDVESVAEYASSLPKTAPPATLVGGNAAAGETSYTTVCTVCHGAEGLGNELMHAPALVGKPDWYLLLQLEKFRGGQRGASPEDPFGSQMQAMSMTLKDEQAMKDVLAYIRTLSK